MIEFLLKFFLGHTLGREFPAKKNQFIFCCTITLFTLLSQQATGQHVDTWLTADRAVNSPPLPSPGQLQLFTPLPPADGTPVTTWYDFIDFTLQDAVRHPLNPADYPLAPPAGFEHSFGAPPFLNPVGSVPGIPTLRRNIFNFNPAIEFDGSGNGQALHLRSDSRSETTIFIVFRAQGAGNSAETQRLLFGGDIETHHNSTTNLSLGVSDGNRFSIGRTWAVGGTYFQGGGIDLLGEPTVGVFVRDIDPLSFEEENLRTKVNGLNDINATRNHPLAADDLYLFNRLGKHFNSNDSNRNLTGDIAEILVADGSLDANSIQRVESYLAIKYGITLNNIGQLGSVVGNQGYNYLAADGTIIWNIDPTYQYDISGIGKDRYEDFDAGLPGTQGDLKLRYNFYQRISKSVNTEARVTISTNSNFASDNLDNSRTSIDTGPSSFSYDHNYLLWGNDHASIALTNIELPISGDIIQRISREWRVQSTQTPGRTLISGVSIRVDLSGSAILPNEACRIQLMIDRDGNGDFTDGTIDFVTATSIVGTDVFFNDVDFEHLDVFSIGLIEVPELDDPAEDDVVVCDEYTLPAITGINLTGNEAYFTEADGNGTEYAPGDIIAYADYPPGDYPITLYIYDETGTTPNCFDENSFTITINDTPVVDAPANVTACDSYALSAGDDITTTTTVYVFAETGSTPNCSAENSFTITINDTPTINVDFSTDPTTCGGNDGSIAFMFTNVPDGNYDINYDAGTFNAVSVNAGSAVVNGLPAGNYNNLRITVAGCTSTDDPSVTLTAPGAPNIDPLADVVACDGYTLPAITGINLTGNEAYYDMPNGGGTQYLQGAVYNVPGNSTLYIYDENGICSAENSFTITITGFSITTNIEHETCWESANGSVSVTIGNTVFPVTVQLNNMEPMIFNTDSFSIDDLSPGNYEMSVIDNTGCQSNTSFSVLSGGPNLGASVDVVYFCDSDLPSNTIAVTLSDPSVSNNVLYALDSTDPNDFILSPDFGDIIAGEHSLFIMHNNGCMGEIPFEVESFEPLELTLTSEYVNQITANVTGGTSPYTYYFDNNSGTDSNTYTITRSGTFTVRVVDSNGCEVLQSTSMNLMEITIPDFFTPNFDGQNDFWAPRNTEMFLDIETFIFDRYGRKIQILGPTDKWDGEYDSNPMPSGDYWYIVKLNDGSGREFVGHFTLYR